MKKLAIGVVVAGVIALVGQLAIAPAFAHGPVPNSVPTNIPYISSLKPIAPTNVKAGGTYHPALSAKQVTIGPPGIVFDYASPAGIDTGLTLNTDTGDFPIPSTWTPGTYRLKTVYIQGGAAGLHMRDGEFIGFPSAAPIEFGSFWLNLPALDLNVS